MFSNNSFSIRGIFLISYFFLEKFLLFRALDMLFVLQRNFELGTSCKLAPTGANAVQINKNFFILNYFNLFFVFPFLIY
jgi:hypothetical protein